jgi:hypothetical protein
MAACQSASGASQCAQNTVGVCGGQNGESYVSDGVHAWVYRGNDKGLVGALTSIVVGASSCLVGASPWH